MEEKEKVTHQRCQCSGSPPASLAVSPVPATAPALLRMAQSGIGCGCVFSVSFRCSFPCSTLFALLAAYSAVAWPCLPLLLNVLTQHRAPPLLPEEIGNFSRAVVFTKSIVGPPPAADSQFTWMNDTAQVHLFSLSLTTKQAAADRAIDCSCYAAARER